MKRKLLILFMLLGCTVAKPVTTVCLPKACYRSFYTTLRVWEKRFGRVPEACQYLDSEFTVQVVPASSIPCQTHRGFKIVGCTETTPEKAIYLLEGQTQTALVDVSVHEWEHALVECVFGDPDKEHLRNELWMEFGSQTIEIQAQAEAQIGSCL